MPRTLKSPQVDLKEYMITNRGEVGPDRELACLGVEVPGV